MSSDGRDDPEHAASAPGELSTTEESFRLLIQSVKDFAIFMLDPEGRVASWNPGAQHIKGYAAHEIVRQHFSRFYTAEDVAAGYPQRHLAEAAERGRVELEAWRVRKDGSRFWASVVITALFDEQGAVRGFAKLTRDVTERRRLAFLGDASAVLSASRDYETTLASVAKLSVPFMADWAAVQLLEGHRLRTVAVAHVDPAKARLGWELDRRYPTDPRAATGAGRVLRTRVPELFPEVTDDLLRATTTDAEHYRIMHELGLRSAVIVPLIARDEALGVMVYVRTHEGNRYDAGTLGLAEEIARRAALAIENARAHQALEKERAWLRQVVDQMPSGVLIADAPSGRILVSNTAAQRTAGPAIGEYASQAGGSRPLTKSGRILAPDESPLSRALRGEHLRDEEHEFGRNGGETVISISAAPVRDRDGNVVSAVATFQDVTERKRERAAREQEALSRERFIGILGHDLRTPLTAIVSGAGLLYRRDLADAEKRVVARIAASAERMTRMISDVLDLTRARMGGGIRIARRPTSLQDICREVIDELQEAHPGAEIRFDATARGEGTWDGDRMAQVFSNIIGNAVDHGRKGAPVSIHLREEEASVTLSVHNEGDRIPAELLPHLFDPFRRGGSGSGPRSGGLGLGLYIAREIVTAHGGFIRVDTDENGSTFVIVLPRTAQGRTG